MSHIIFFLAGLVVGWNFLKQPAAAKALVDNLVAWFRT